MHKTFGKRFQHLRKEKDLTQEDIARACNISPQAVSKWENDISYPDITILVTLSELLDVSLDELLGKSNDQPIYVPKEKRKNINEMLLKVIIDSSDGDKIKINIPVSLLFVLNDSGMNLPQINNNESLKNIDIKQLIELIESGVIGTLMEIESADGDTVIITVE